MKVSKMSGRLGPALIGTGCANALRNTYAAAPQVIPCQLSCCKYKARQRYRIIVRHQASEILTCISTEQHVSITFRHSDGETDVRPFYIGATSASSGASHQVCMVTSSFNRLTYRAKQIGPNWRQNLSSKHCCKVTAIYSDLLWWNIEWDCSKVDFCVGIGAR